MPKLSMRDAEALFTLAQTVEVRLRRLMVRDPSNGRVKDNLLKAAQLIDQAGVAIRDSRGK